MVPSVLLVEAEPSLARRLCWILETDGYEATVATVPQQAAQLTRHRFDAVIVNSDDPPQDKWNLIQELRFRLPAANIIDLHSAALTNMRHIHASGADSYIHMPFDAATLLEELERLLARRRKHPRAG